MTDAPRKYCYVPISNFTLLDMACGEITEAFGVSPMHVGSSTQRPDWRDVDVRLVLKDDEFDVIFADRSPAFWSLICLSITEYLSRVSGLPVDFQIQRMTEANKKYGDCFRNPLGGRRIYAGGPDAKVGVSENDG